MRFFRSKNLAHDITWIVVLASSAALGTFVAALLVYDSISYRNMLQNRLATLADVIGQNSTAALSFNDQATAVEVLEGLRAEPPVVSACLYDLSGQLFAEYHRQARVERCPALVPAESWKDDHAGVVRKVNFHGEPVGTVMLHSTLEDLERRRWRLVLVALGGIVLALGVGAIAGALLQRKVSQPILNLSRAMQEVTAKQNFDARISVAGCDEIAGLGHGFNAMLGELERRDVSKRQAEARLEEQAFNDELTGLPNRRLFADRLSQTLSLAERENWTVALLYIDLDGFKLVNDSLGHSFGDTLLFEVAQRLQSRVRHSDTLARMGGDEFMVILRNLGRKEIAGQVADTLLETLRQPFQIDRHEITIGASIGITIFPENARHEIELMQQADSAMYAAKKDGKNHAVYFTPELGLLARERLNLESQLRGAVARGEIQVEYQPEFDVTTGKIVRFEALARWLHPTLGFISPTKFIPIAEETGLIIPLGAYILQRACTEAARWQILSAWPIQVAVNVSSVQFNRENFVDELLAELRSSGLRPDLLQIELTESVMLGAVERAAEKMRELRAHGVGLAIDDFGTGYSCLSYLPNLPFDALKVDRSFVRDLNSRPEAVAMVHSLVALAHNIGMRVIVEGVEEPSQLDVIKKLGCNEVQGYLMGRPMLEPAELIEQRNKLSEDKPKAHVGVEFGLA